MLCYTIVNINIMLECSIKLKHSKILSQFFYSISVPTWHLEQKLFEKKKITPQTILIKEIIVTGSTSIDNVILNKLTAALFANSRCNMSIFSRMRSASSKACLLRWVKLPNRSHWSQIRWHLALTEALSWYSKVLKTEHT